MVWRKKNNNENELRTMTYSKWKKRRKENSYSEIKRVIISGYCGVFIHFVSITEYSGVVMDVLWTWFVLETEVMQLI